MNIFLASLVLMLNYIESQILCEILIQGGYINLYLLNQTYFGFTIFCMLHLNKISLPILDFISINYNLLYITLLCNLILKLICEKIFNSYNLFETMNFKYLNITFLVIFFSINLSDFMNNIEIIFLSGGGRWKSANWHFVKHFIQVTIWDPLYNIQKSQ